MSLSVHVRPSAVNPNGKLPLVCGYQLRWRAGGRDLSVRTVTLHYVSSQQSLGIRRLWRCLVPLGAPRGWSPVQIQQVVEGEEGSKLKEMNKCQCLVTFLCVSADLNVSACAHYCVPHMSTYLVYVRFSRILVKGLVCSCVWCFRHAECPNQMK